MLASTMVIYYYMKSLGNDVNNLFDNTHVRIKIYGDFFHGIIYIDSEGRHVRIFHFYFNTAST